MSILLGKALRAARKQKGLTQIQVAKKMGLTRPAVGQWEAGTSDPSTENLIKVCGILGLDMAAATGGMAKIVSVPMGDGETVNMIQDRRPEFREMEDELLREFGDLPKLRQSALRDVPVHGVAAGGADADFYTNGETIDFVRRPPGILRAKDVYALYVVGNSMAPRFEEGELVYVSPTRLPVIGDYVIIELIPDDPGDRTGRGYIKRLARRTATKVICEQFNPSKSVEFAVSAIKSLHRVIPWNEVLGI